MCGVSKFFLRVSKLESFGAVRPSPSPAQEWGLLWAVPGSFPGFVKLASLGWQIPDRYRIVRRGDRHQPTYSNLRNRGAGFIEPAGPRGAMTWPCPKVRQSSSQSYHRPIITGEILDSEALGSVIASFHRNWFVHLASRCDLDGSSAGSYAPTPQGANLRSAIRAPELKRASFASPPSVRTPHCNRLGTYQYPFTFYGTTKPRREDLGRAGPCRTWVLIRPLHMGAVI